jgi:hypothetical protein
LGVDGPLEVTAGDAVFDLDFGVHDAGGFRVGCGSNSLPDRVARS